MRNHHYFLLFVLSFMPGSCFSQVDFKTQRENMVEKQLMARDITDAATLSAMRKVPRHNFVPDDVRNQAYTDGPLPIGEGQTISQPYIVAYMTQALQLIATDKVLEIGTGSGYQAAVLGEIVDSVYTIEIVERLGTMASERLKDLGYGNILVKIGDGYHGWKEKGPFDAIIVTAGAAEIPQPLLDQLNEGGRLIIPLGANNSIRQLVLSRKKNGKIKSKNLIPVRFVPFTRIPD